MRFLNRLWLWLFYRKGWLVGPFIDGRNYSKGLPWRPGPGPSITGGEPHDLTRPCNGLAGTIRGRYRLTGKAVPVEGGEPLLTAHFRRADVNWSGKPEHEHHRWYAAGPFRAPLVPGEHSFEIPLTPDAWKGVMSLEGTGDPARFRQSLKDARRVGLGFGARGGVMHGVRLEGTFELLEWSVGR